MKYHYLHHNSHATKALSAYYMTPIDWFLEHSLGFLQWFQLREISPYWLVATNIAVYNSFITHSAWDFTYGPNVKTHFIHHNYKVE